MSGLPTTEASIDALALLVHWVGHDILDLGGGLVNILLPIGLVFHLSLLLGTSLLHWLYFLPWLKLVLVIIVGGLITRYKFVVSLSRVWKSGKSNILRVHLSCGFNPPRNLSSFISSVATSYRE